MSNKKILAELEAAVERRQDHNLLSQEQHADRLALVGLDKDSDEAGQIRQRITLRRRKLAKEHNLFKRG